MGILRKECNIWPDEAPQSAKKVEIDSVRVNIHDNDLNQKKSLISNWVTGFLKRRDAAGVANGL